MQKAHIEQIQQQMSERRKAETTKVGSRRKKPVLTELPKVWCADGLFYLVTCIFNG